VVNPVNITAPTIIMRGQHDGIASMEDLLAFFAKLPNPDKQFTVMSGISHASFQQKNYMTVYHILASWFAQRHPDRVARLALDALVWTGENSPTLAERRKKLPEFRTKNRRPMDKAFVYSIFNRDHPGAAEDRVIDAFADAILSLDDSVPTGTYVDMCSRLPLVDPDKITVPTIVMRGQWDGIATFDDLIEFFRRLPNPDKQFAVMPGISHASFQQKNYMLVYHILHGFFSQPEPVFRG
jgi:pimeloyl-ACP methyl ester carboxylesterase